MGPLIISNLSKATVVHVFESQWDAFAVADKLALHEKEDVALIVTRGAGNGALISGLIPSTATVFAWKQNDELKNGKRAGDEWLKAFATLAGASVQVVITPERFKDPIEWTQKGGATVNDLQQAINAAQLRRMHEHGAASVVSSLNSPVLCCALVDDYPSPMPPAAFYGLAGEIVRRIEPHTEADSAALLFQTLTAFGNLIGHNQYIVADGARHYLNLYGVLVGQSSKGRKGTSWIQVANVMARIDADWKQDRVTHGLSSGEGLIWAVRHPIEETKAIFDKGRHTGEYETYIANHGEDDKRLPIIESEFANVLKVMAREGNTLSPIIRTAWDYGDLRTMVKNSPAKATGAHISILDTSRGTSCGDC